MEATWEIIAAQLPAAALFGVFALLLFGLFLRYIQSEQRANREERKAFLTSLGKITDQVHELSGDVKDLKETVSRKRGL